MFENLAGKVLTRLLSKYFVSGGSSSVPSTPSSSSSSSSGKAAAPSPRDRKSAQLGVWSGYVSLQNLELRRDVINEKFRQKGTPLELVSCTFERIEITIPWAKLAASSDDSAVVVVVLDGIHALFRTNFEHDDEALRREAIHSRRRALLDSESFDREATNSAKATTSTTISGFLQKRMTEGLLRDIMEKLHVHIRDVHIRIEDVDSDETNPFAFGLTLESLHIHREDEDPETAKDAKTSQERSQVIRKVSELNHFGVYWNALDYVEGLPPELSVLHAKEGMSPQQLARILDESIARRATSLSSPSSARRPPKHTYLLKPLDAVFRGVLSTTPRDLEARPALVGSIDVEDLAVNLRDFQLDQILDLKANIKEHQFSKPYRPYRPTTPVLLNPRAWWHYALKVVQMELRQSRMRWSWSRFNQRFALRRRYSDLYERHRRYPNSRQEASRTATTSGGLRPSPSLQSLPALLAEATTETVAAGGTPDEGAGPSIQSVTRSHPQRPQSQQRLTQEEYDELREMEDGVRGDLTVDDIVLYRALVHVKLAGELVNRVQTPSRLQSIVGAFVTEDIGSQEEYRRLMAYLERATTTRDDLSPTSSEQSLVAVKFNAKLGHGSISLFSPLDSTTDLAQHRRIHERFLDVSMSTLSSGLTIYGNYESSKVELSLDDFGVSEILSSREQVVVVRRPGDDQTRSDHLVYCELSNRPPTSIECDVGLHASVEAVEVMLSPQCEWIGKLKKILPSSITPSRSAFWNAISLASINALSGKQGFFAKVDAAWRKHKNIEVDVNLDAPIIKVASGSGCTFCVDLGRAVVTTEHLAGLAQGKLNFTTIQTAKRIVAVAEANVQPSDVFDDGTLDSGSKKGRSRSTTRPTSSAMIDNDSSDGSSRGSLVAGKRHMSLGSVNDNMFVSWVQRNESTRETETLPNEHRSAFYNTYHVQLAETRVFLVKQAETPTTETSIVSKFQASVALDLSVLPTDHTLCRLKSRCEIDEVVVNLEEATLVEMMKLAHAWEKALKNDTRTNFDIVTPPENSGRRPRRQSMLRDELLGPTVESMQAAPIVDVASDAASVVDESEFLDAFQGEDVDFGGGDWAADTESVIKGADVSSLGYRRRSNRSVSDVSSISDVSQSRRSRLQAKSAYLSAENLARLEERGGEDESADSSDDIADDDDSFHSAISFGDRDELAKALESDIGKAEREILRATENLRDFNQRNVEGDMVISEEEANSRRKQRRLLRLEVDRARAEIRALHAARHDLSSAQAPIHLDTQEDALRSSEREFGEPSEDGATTRARSVLRSRRNRKSTFERSNLHSLTTDMIREVFRGSLVVHTLTVHVRGNDGIAIETMCSNFTFAMLHRAHDTKLYLGLEKSSIALSTKVDGVVDRSHLLSGGGANSAGFPKKQFYHMVADDNKFFTLILDMRHRVRTNDAAAYPARLTRARFLFGHIEIVPDQRAVSLVSSLASGIKNTASENTVKKHSGKEEIKLRRFVNKLISVTADHINFTDISMRMSTCRLRIQENMVCIGTMDFSNVTIRLSGVATPEPHVGRWQVDMKCWNFQVMQIGVEPNEPNSVLELFGSKDSSGPLLLCRARIHVAPVALIDGWVVAASKSSTVNESGLNRRGIDVHVGVQLRKTQVVAAVDAFERIKDSLLYQVKSPHRKETAVEGTLPPSSNGGDITFRWQIDMQNHNILVVLPRTSQLAETQGGGESRLLLQMGIRGRFEQEEGFGVRCQAKLTGVRLARSSDDWPVMEIGSIILSSVRQMQLHGLGQAPLERLELPQGSPWFDEDFQGGLTTDGAHKFAVSTSISDVRLSLSPSALLLAKNSIPKKKKRSPKAGESAGGPSAFQRLLGGSYSVSGSIPMVELALFREHPSKRGLESADKIALMDFVGCDGSWSLQRDKTSARVAVTDFAVYDASSTPRIRALGLEQGTDWSHQPSPEPQRFLSLSAVLSKRLQTIPALHVELQWGRIQVLALPPLVQSLYSFVSSLKSMEEATAKASDQPKLKSRTSAPFGVQVVTFSFNTAGFECILPTRNTFVYLREGLKDPLNAVSFRWTSKFEGALAVVDGAKLAKTDSVQVLADAFSKDSHKVVQLLYQFWEANMGASGGTVVEGGVLATEKVAFVTIADLSVTGFQALRTCIQPSLMSSKSTCFKISPPAVGEQRITSPINFSLRHRLTGTSLPNNLRTDQQFQVSQSAALESDIVDVLLYIRQSAGGFSDAYKVSVKPILLMVKAKKAHAPKSQDGSARPSMVLNTLTNVTTTSSVQIRGLQITCVPGGATRLTESPIVKCAFKNLRFGVASVGVPSDVATLVPSRRLTSSFQLGSERARHGHARDDLSSSTLTHLTLGGWLNAEFSAHYHNRRVVAWEPMVEPWQADIRFGSDLVRAINLSPSVQPTMQSSDFQDSRVALPSLTDFIPEVIPESAGERLRDIGRLLRSPFQTDYREQASGKDSFATVVKTHADLSYLLLVTIAPNLISLALYPPLPNALDAHTSHQKKIMSLPGLEQMNWLKLFGHPRSNFSGVARPAMKCFVSDTQPLNINVTGALIENLSGFLGTEKSRSVIPHWIRNESGLTVRFFEDLENERTKRGEKPSPTTLANGKEIPLSLKRSLSQSCDPHNAFVSLELGIFEEVIGRVNPADFETSKGSRVSSFFYKTVGKIPVDTVGVHEVRVYKNSRLLSNADRSKNPDSVGSVVVRVSLKGGIKLVSIESPLLVLNSTDHDLLCEVRDSDGISLLWSALIPLQTRDAGSNSQGSSSIPVPIDLVPSIDSGKGTLSICALTSGDNSMTSPVVPGNVSDRPMFEIDAPEPYSSKSLSRGLLGTQDLSFIALNPRKEVAALGYAKFVNANVCSLRIGSFLVEGPKEKQLAATSLSSIPQQRMLFFRPPLVIHNQLPVPVQVRVRVKMETGLRAVSSTANLLDLAAKDGMDVGSKKTGGPGSWTDVGTVDCGKWVCWTGPVPTDQVEIQLKVLDKEGEQSKKFPSWSSPSTILSMDEVDPMQRANGKLEEEQRARQMQLVDSAGRSLWVSVAVSIASTHDADIAHLDDVRQFAKGLPTAPRVASLFVPFWIVDSTDQDLEFASNNVIAGQSEELSVHRRGRNERLAKSTKSDTRSLGLAELMDGDHFLHLSARSTFDVLMLGDLRASRVSIRSRAGRVSGEEGIEHISPWCDPIPIQNGVTFSDFVVSPPTTSIDSSLEPLALRSQIVRAPDWLGGRRGTRLIHIFSRYKVINEMSRDLEVMVGQGTDTTTLIRAGSDPTPLHFDDSRPIRFRPREFGWAWSGRIEMKAKQREVTLRIVHKLKGQVIIATVELLIGAKSSSNLIVFRNASPPPFRIENQTMYPFRYGQSSLFSVDESSQMWKSNDFALYSTLLPYHNADFAWDEPDESYRSVSLELGDSAFTGKQFNDNETRILGSFALEKIAPGTVIKPRNRSFVCQVIADGPTRVLRIADAGFATNDGTEQNESLAQSFVKAAATYEVPSWVELRLSHGIGISVVDWTPQELLYVFLGDITVERRVDAKHETFSLGLGSLSVDNQLWTTPHPVLMTVGRRRRPSTSVERRPRRRHNAMALRWKRELGEKGSLMLIENIEFSIDPILLRVDGHLAEFVLNMTSLTSGKGSKGENVGELSMDETIRSLLDIRDVQHAESSQTAGQLQDDDGDFLATAAVAAKERFKRQRGALPSPLYGVAKGKTKQRSVSQSRLKFYLDKLRISTIVSEISWSGPLPTTLVRLPRVVRPVLTFEGLPVRFRPLATYHTYGTTRDIVEELKSHYISIWRIFDIILGITLKPTFLIRAVIYTWRESVASSLDAVSKLLVSYDRTIQGHFGIEQKQRPSSSKGGMGVQHGKTFGWLYKTTVMQPCLLLGTACRSSSSVAASLSTALRYSGGRELDGLQGVRFRTPRFFANANGRDLLVEYVEGENAGKAILSRVRMGLHLGEGYVYHAEKIRLPTSKAASQADLESTSLIVMVTSARILLLSGDRDANFCSVVWETTFESLISAEIDEYENAYFDMVKLWHLMDTEHAAGNIDESLNAYSALASGNADFGLDILLCKSMFVPQNVARVLKAKITKVHEALEQ